MQQCSMATIVAIRRQRVNVLDANVRAIKENTEASVLVTNEMGLELNV
jgi:hypothetical protein